MAENTADQSTDSGGITEEEQAAFIASFGGKAVPGHISSTTVVPQQPRKKERRTRAVGAIEDTDVLTSRSPTKRLASNVRRKQDLSGAIGKQVKTFTPDSWKGFLTMIANGAKKPDLLNDLGITNASFNIWIATTEGAGVEYENARLQWLRRDWPMELIEDIMIDIALRKPVAEICQERSLSEPNFYRVVLREPTYAEMFDDARQIAMEAYADDLVRIVDEIELDGVNTTANSAKVNKARLKSDNLKFLMERLHPKRFGRTTKQEIDLHTTVDHAEELGKARKRKMGAAKLKDELLAEAGTTVH